MSKSINSCTFIGNLGKKPEMRFTPTGKSVTSFSMAMNREWKNEAGEKQSETTWANFEAWGKAGEIINQYCDKGQQLYVEGRYKQERYEKDGETKYFTKFVVTDFMFLGGNRSGETVHAEAPEASVDEAFPVGPVAAGAPAQDIPF